MTSSSCASCGGAALAKVGGRWLCARCGLEETAVAGAPAAGRPGTSRPLRRSAAALIGSSLAAKILIGAAALAAVGGVLVADPGSHGSTPPRVTTTAASRADAAATTAPAAVDRDATPAPASVVPAGDGPPSETPGAGEMPPDVARFVDDLQDWADCVQEQAQQFAASRPDPGSGFDPAVCGERPAPPAASPATPGGATVPGSPPGKTAAQPAGGAAAARDDDGSPQSPGSMKPSP